MELYELSLNQYVEVKLLRLNKPKFNSQILPFTGSYNSLEDLQALENEDNFLNSNVSPYENKFQEFNLHEYSSVGIDNMFQISNSFGKVLFCESLEALLIINNISDKEIKIKDFKVKVSNEVLEGYDSMYRKTEYNLINSQNIIAIPAHQFYNQKIRLNADIMCKYSLEIDIQYISSYFVEEFIKHSANKIVKTISSQYVIEGNSSVVRKYYKKFLFATNLPFKIKEKFVNDNMEKCYVEINLINQCQYSLHITDVLLVPDSDKGGSNNNLNNQSNLITCLQDKELKNFMMEPDEEINIVFMLNNYKSVISFVRKYIINLTFLKYIGI
jgi:hypothetical protein